MYLVNNCPSSPIQPIKMGIRVTHQARNRATRMQSPAPSVSSQEVKTGTKDFLRNILNNTFFPKKPSLKGKSKQERRKRRELYHQKRNIAISRIQAIEQFIPEKLQNTIIEYIHGSDTSKPKTLENSSLEHWSFRELLTRLLRQSDNKESAIQAVDNLNFKVLKRALSDSSASTDY
jgi:hypothetical protein